ncbi:hypothetical protein FHX79_115425 [Streptomyces cavourensis]|uniref:Uncharacterized protein n=2 Tax=Streptomyces TaxID=1883 RepID=A0ABY5F5D4_9ACTN|nr:MULTISPECIES: hypothetical protein [Streptomyces]TQO33529.1 hypothetical protein FHX79_115425 [Streptomyces cavourensis]UTR78893.1 hypothetical protein NLU04_10725 [Streptomyces cavourensis]GGU88425.1 hypothetical protein GCM10010498_53890 [Streptomyces cavourensis]
MPGGGACGWITTTARGGSREQGTEKNGAAADRANAEARAVRAAPSSMPAPVRPWGFVPAGLAQPARLWHAPADQGVPLRAAEALFPVARLTERREPDHIPSGETLRELFGELGGAGLQSTPRRHSRISRWPR